MVTVEAQPSPLTFDLGRTVLLVIDMQNDFAAKGGMFERAGIDVSMIQAAIAPTARVLESARRQGIKVVYLKMAFRPDLSDAGLPDSPNWRVHSFAHVGETVRAPDGTESRILIRDTWNTEIVSELQPQPGDVVVYKHRYSGFYQTDLDNILREMNAKYLVVTGCTTSVCVESTVRDAMFRDYSCLLLADCMAEPIGREFPRSNHDASLSVIQTMFGWICRSDQFIQALDPRPARVSALAR
jgi:ureidoacrylate peracid hydrolase